MADVERDSRVNIEVAYAKPSEQRILSVQVDEGTSVLDAVRQSGICEQFPEIDPDSARLGIFGKAVARPGEQAVQEGQRIEVYRPLIADPKEVRRKRAEKARLKKEVSA